MSLNKHILTRTEPTIPMEPLLFSSNSEEDGKTAISRDIGSRAPLISVNGYVFMEEDVTHMILDLNGVIPKITVTVNDSESYFMVDNYPRSGDVLSIRIAARQTDTYKDIRMDFDIESVKSVPKAPESHGLGSSTYVFIAIIKVPGLFAETCQSFAQNSSLGHLEELATNLNLGFATNIDSPAPDDLMSLIIPYQTMYDTIRNVVNRSYVSDDSFQTYSIDIHYYLTYVDLNKVLNSASETDITFANFEDRFDEIPGEESDKIRTELILTTSEKAANTSLYISKFALKYGGGTIARTHGYARNIQFYENDPMHSAGGLGEIRANIEAISSINMLDIEEPLKGRRGEDRYLNEVKYKYTGRSSNSRGVNNTHPQYMYSAVHNAQNLAELKKLQLEIELPTINHAIYKYQSIPVLIYSEGASQANATDIIEGKKNDEGFDNNGIGEGEEMVAGRQNRNEFLSGQYIVGGIQYVYSRKKGFRQKLTLLRREWPTRMNNIKNS